LDEAPITPKRELGAKIEIRLEGMGNAEFLRVGLAVKGPSLADVYLGWAGILREARGHADSLLLSITSEGWLLTHLFIFGALFDHLVLLASEAGLIFALLVLRAGFNFAKIVSLVV